MSDPFPAVELREQYDYLAPDGSEIRLLVDMRRGGLCHCTLPGRSVSKATSHKTVDEVWYCISGTGEIWRKNSSGERIMPLHKGMSVAILQGTAFQFRAIGDDPLVLLTTTIPPWPGPDEAIPEKGTWDAVKTRA